MTPNSDMALFIICWDNGLLLDDTKQLPESMLTYFFFQETAFENVVCKFFAILYGRNVLFFLC